MKYESFHWSNITPIENSSVHSMIMPDCIYFYNSKSSFFRIFFCFNSIILSNTLIRADSPSKINNSKSLVAISIGVKYIYRVMKWAENVPSTSRPVDRKCFKTLGNSCCSLSSSTLHMLFSFGKFLVYTKRQFFWCIS